MSAPPKSVPVHLEPTRLKRVEPEASAEQLEFERKLALFTTVFAKDGAVSLLDGISGNGRFRAKEFSRQTSKLDSASRQARVALAFGPRNDAPSRLRELFQQAGPDLRRHMYQHLPSFLRTAFPEMAAGAVAVPEALAPACEAQKALASRMPWEAMR